VPHLYWILDVLFRRRSAGFWIAVPWKTWYFRVGSLRGPVLTLDPEISAGCLMDVRAARVHSRLL
jgi:hypothetical protein